MSHIHTQPGQYDFTVSAFIIRTDFDAPKIVLHRHKKLGKWLQFGGHVELNENPWEALTHEVLEESGYDIAQLELIEVAKGPNLSNDFSHPLPFCVNSHPFSDEHSHTDLAYAFRTNQTPNHKIAKGESTDVQYFSRDELASLPLTEIFQNVKEIGLFVFDNLL